MVDYLSKRGLCMSAGAVLTKANLTKSLFPNPTQYRTARYPRILLTNEEMQEVKAVQPKGTGSGSACIPTADSLETLRPQAGGLSMGCCWVSAKW